MESRKQELKVKGAANVLEVSPITIRRLNRRGILKARRNFLGHRIFELDELLKVKAEREELRD